MPPTKRILAFGDSHSCFWNGTNGISKNFFPSTTFAGIDIFHLGPVTAYGASVVDPQHEAVHRLTAHLDSKQGIYGALLFCFGEIDCRCHIVKHAAQSGSSIKNVAQKTAQGYFAFVKRLIDQYQLPGVVWGPIPSSPPENFHFNPRFPAVGSVEERNYATFVFNTTLAELAQSNARISHISVFEELTGHSGITQAEYLFDGCHLSNALLPLAQRRLHSALLDLGGQELATATGVDSGSMSVETAPVSPSWRIWRIAPQWALRDLAHGQPYTSSSTLKGYETKPFDEAASDPFRFHTDIENNPYILIDLRASYWIERIVVQNRRDGYQARARSLAVGVSSIKDNFESVFAPPETEWDSFETLTIEVASKLPNRFVKLSLRERNYFHLSSVQVDVRTFLRGNVATRKTEFLQAAR